MIEKHFTLDKTLKGNDHYHAMDQQDVIEIIKEVNQLDMILGDGKLCCMEGEKKSRLNARRSLVAQTDIPAGTVITGEILTFKRPGSGISVSRMKEIVGKKAAVDIRKDMILKENMICFLQKM